MMSGSSLHPSVLHGFNMPNMVIHIRVSPLLLPKNSTPFHIPVMCELCKRSPRFCWWLSQQLCKLSVQDICTFSTYGISLYQPLSLGVQITFHTTKWLSWTLRIYFQYIQLPKFCCLLEKELKSTDKKKHSVNNWI